jgi:hypothetical protein
MATVTQRTEADKVRRRRPAPTTGKAAANGKPPSRRARLAEIKTEVAAIQKQARDEHEAEKDRKRRELDYLRALLAHPRAESAVDDVLSMMNQSFGGGDWADQADEMVPALVIIEAMKALEEKAGKGGAA